MKKGCFISGIAFITVAIGAGSYIIKKYGTDFMSFGKEKVVNAAVEDFGNYLNKKVDYSPQRDSLIAIVIKYRDKLKIDGFKNSMDDFKNFMKKAKYIVSDNIIESSEIIELKEMASKK